MPNDTLFDPVLLDRCVMSLAEVIRFREEARMCVRKDDESGVHVVAYVHPDGRVLIDAVRPPTLD